MDFDMTEINFIHMHKTVVSEVISSTIITKSINMMKLNSIVRRHARVEHEQDQEEAPTDPSPSTSVKRKLTLKTTAGKRGKKRKHEEVSSHSTNAPQASVVPDVVYIPEFKEVTTQTVTEEELLTQEEQYFQQEHIERVRQLLMVDFIKEEDFDEDYPATDSAEDN